MLCQARKGIDKNGSPLKPCKEQRGLRYFSQEKSEKLQVEPFFNPINRLSSKKSSPLGSEKRFSHSIKKDDRPKEKSHFLQSENEEVVAHSTEKKANAANKLNQEKTAQNNIRIHCKLSDRFPNIRDYVTSQSNPSSQISQRPDSIRNGPDPPIRKRHYKELQKIRRLYCHPAEKLKVLRDCNGRRAYYEGRIELSNKFDSKANLFRVFTDNDLGVKYRDQKTLQETYMDDDCQTDSEQINLAINKSRKQVESSLKRIKRDNYIYELIKGMNDSDASFCLSSQNSLPSDSDSTSLGFKFSNESKFL